MPIDDDVEGCLHVERELVICEHAPCLQMARELVEDGPLEEAKDADRLQKFIKV